VEIVVMVVVPGRWAAMPVVAVGTVVVVPGAAVRDVPSTGLAVVAVIGAVTVGAVTVGVVTVGAVTVGAVAVPAGAAVVAVGAVVTPVGRVIPGIVVVGCFSIVPVVGRAVVVIAPWEVVVLVTPGMVGTVGVAAVPAGLAAEVAAVVPLGLTPGIAAADVVFSTLGSVTGGIAVVAPVVGLVAVAPVCWVTPGMTVVVGVFTAVPVPVTGRTPVTVLDPTAVEDAAWATAAGLGREMGRDGPVMAAVAIARLPTLNVSGSADLTLNCCPTPGPPYPPGSISRTPTAGLLAESAGRIESWADAVPLSLLPVPPVSTSSNACLPAPPKETSSNMTDRLCPGRIILSDLVWTCFPSSMRAACTSTRGCE